ELRFCEAVIKELYKKQHSSFAFVFYNPVDPVALNIPDYFKIIKKPMDLSLMNSKLKTNAYNSASEFEADMRLMLSNCFKFNPEGTPVHGFGKKMEKLFNEKWAEKAKYIAENTVERSPASASPAAEEVKEEASEEEEDTSEISKLEKALADMQKQLAMMKKQKDGGPPAKKSKASKTTPAAASTKKASKKPKATRQRQLSVDEKYELSEKINNLSA